jgi:hypothetical protein
MHATGKNSVPPATPSRVSRSIFSEISILGIIHRSKSSKEERKNRKKAFTAIATGTIDHLSTTARPGQDTVKMSQTRIRTLMVAVLGTQSLRLGAMEKPLCFLRS